MISMFTLNGFGIVKMSTRQIKRSITLFEVLIVMSLIAVALGASFIPVSKALRGEKFERGVEQLTAKIALAQEVMLDFQTDVSLFLFQEGNEIKCVIKTHKKLPTYLEKSLNRYKTINGIEQMAFNNEVHKDIEIQFDGVLGTVSKGTLTLISNKKEVTLNLKGYPAHITRGEHAEANSQKVNEEASYPEEIISII